MFIAFDDQEYYLDHTTIVPAKRYSTIKLAIVLFPPHTHVHLDCKITPDTFSIVLL